jgi:hypothetical protein
MCDARQPLRYLKDSLAAGGLQPEGPYELSRPLDPSTITAGAHRVEQKSPDDRPYTLIIWKEGDAAAGLGLV